MVKNELLDLKALYTRRQEVLEVMGEKNMVLSKYYIYLLMEAPVICLKVSCFQ